MSYIVKTGDNLTKIAKKHGLSLEELMKLNNISKDKMNFILVGQKLKVSNDTPNTSGKPYKPNVVMAPSQTPVKQEQEQEQKQDSVPQISKNTYIPWVPTYITGDQCGVDGCAKYANDTLKSHTDAKGRKLYSPNNIGGHAWTRLTAGADNKMVYSAYDGVDYDTSNAKDLEIYQLYQQAVDANDSKAAAKYAALLQKSVGHLSEKRNKEAADRFLKEFDSKTLDKNKTYMVNMYYKGSPSAGVAWYGAQNGTTGTHTGNVYWDPKTESWRISHNIHGTVHDDDFIKTQGSRRPYAITAIAEAVANDYTETDRREDYRQRKPIRGWIRDQIGWWKQGGQLIPKHQYGKPITSKELIPRDRGDYVYENAEPEGYDLRSLGINRTYDGQTMYGNSDSLPIAHSLQYISKRLPDLANRYGLTINEAKMLMGDAQAIMWKESNGGAKMKVNASNGKIVPNTSNNKKADRMYRTVAGAINNALGRDTSQGYGQVKLKDLRDLPMYSPQTEFELKDYETRTPEFSGLSSFASMAQRYTKLKDIFKNDLSLIYNDEGTLNELGHALLHISHNQGFNNIEKNYQKYKQSGDIQELQQYVGFDYPALSLQVIRGHEVSGSAPTLLPEITVYPT